MVYGGKEPEGAIGRGPDADRIERRRKRKAQQLAESSVDPVRPTNMSMGSLDYTNTKSGYSIGDLPAGGDPKTELADFLQGQHERFVTDFSDYETALVNARDDTSLIDAAPGIVEDQTRIAQGTAERNRERYGYQQTGAERLETQRQDQRQEALSLAGGVNNARLAQRDSNQQLIGNLFNIGQGVYNSATSGLMNATQMQAQRNMAFSNAKTAHKQQSIGFLGSLGRAVASFL